MNLIEKCDKCRRYYRIGEDYKFNKVEIDDGADAKVWYLCDKCTELLVKWMKGKVLSGVENKVLK